MSNITASASLYANIKIQKILMFFNLIQCKIVGMLCPSSTTIAQTIAKILYLSPTDFSLEMNVKVKKIIDLLSIKLRGNLQKKKSPFKDII